MDPMTLMALTSILGSLGGFAFKDNSREKMIRELMRYANPGAVGADAKRLYSEWLQGPAFSQGQTEVYNSANQIASSAASSLAERGLGTSGIGAITGAIGGNTAGFQLASLRGKGMEQALQHAIEIMQARVGGLSGMPNSRNVGAEIYGGGLDALSKYFGIMAMKQPAPAPRASSATPMNRGAAPASSNSPFFSDYFNPLRTSSLLRNGGGF